MIRAAILVLLAPVAAHAQLQLFVGTTNVTNSNYSLEPIAAGSTGDVVILATNMGNGPVTITNIALSSGSGFDIVSTSSIPYPVAPGSSMRIEVQFSAAGSAPLVVSTNQSYAVQVILQATSAPAPTLTVASPCTGPGSSMTVGFGNIVESQTEPCTFVLLNQSSQQLTISVSVTGVGFLPPEPPVTALNLPAGGAPVNFTVTFAPQSAASYAGALTVVTGALTQIYPLTGTAYNPPLPTPTLTFDTNSAQSGQQVTLTMVLPTPSPIAASGSVNLTFQPDPSVAGLASGDPTIVFVANGALSVPFSIQAGSTQATFGGQTGAVFQTGTTTGKITFAVTVTSGAQFSGDPTTSITLAPLPVQVENAAATAIAGALNIQVWGFDNTYSAGEMSFTFYDNSGNPIGAGPVLADFGSQFLNYFATSTDGSAFQMLVSFPITGNAAEVGSVDVQLTNSIGTATITQLAFLNDTGTCVLVGSVLTCPPAITQ